MGVFDIENRENITINTRILNSKHVMSSNCCHLTNVTFQRVLLNGIFILIRTISDGVISPYLCLYDPLTKETKYEFLSTKPWAHDTSPHQFLYAKDKQCIIYEYDAKLYQLYLNEIETDNDLSKFVEIKMNKELNLMLGHHGVTRHWLEMVYIPNYESIFAVRCRRSHLVGILQRIPKATSKMIEKNAACRLFNMKDGGWNKVDEYKYYQQMTKKTFTIRALFYDGDNRVCMIDCDYNLSYFDLKTKKWMKWKRGKCKQNNVHWIDNDVLYGLRQSESYFVLNTLDLKDEDSEWKSESIDIGKNLSLLLFKQPLLQ